MQSHLIISSKLAYRTHYKSHGDEFTQRSVTNTVYKLEDVTNRTEPFEMKSLKKLSKILKMLKISTPVALRRNGWPMDG